MDELEMFIDNSLMQSRNKGYIPTKFISMRGESGTVEAINRLMVQGHIQSGFVRMKKLGLLPLSLEAAVLAFPDRFKRPIREAARFRLDQVEKSA